MSRVPARAVALVSCLEVTIYLLRRRVAALEISRHEVEGASLKLGIGIGVSTLVYLSNAIRLITYMQESMAVDQRT